MRTAQGAFAAFNKHWLGNNHKHFICFTKRSRRVIRLQFIAPRGQGTLYGGARFGRQRDEHCVGIAQNRFHKRVRAVLLLKRHIRTGFICSIRREIRACHHNLLTGI